MVLDDGAEIAVIGGGPSGSFFSIHALNLARFLGKKLNITIYEPKDFRRLGPAGCNHCGGIISEILVQMLAVEGINLPDTVVQRGINSYRLHTAHGSVSIETPNLDKSIATVCRGGGPKGIIGEGMESFDGFLLSLAVKGGAKAMPVRVDEISRNGEKPIIFSRNEKLQEADLVVGAFGANSASWKLFEGLGFGYKKPKLQTTAIAELTFDKEIIRERFGSAVHLFLLPINRLKFAAIIPKKTYVTVCILGKEITAGTITSFLEHPAVKKVFSGADYEISCRCLPKMNVGAPARPFCNRIVACGDSSSTRLLKDGLGAAYYLGKESANTAVLHGVSASDWKKHFMPAYKSLIIDNWYGRFLYTVTEMFKRIPLMTKGMLGVVEKEQCDPKEPRILSSILWDMFTGNERFKRIFPRAFSFRMHRNLLFELERILIS